MLWRGEWGKVHLGSSVGVRSEGWEAAGGRGGVVAHVCEVLQTKEASEKAGRKGQARGIWK